jgi:Glycosyl hydrolase family 99
VRERGYRGTTRLLAAAMSLLLLVGLPHDSAPAQAQTSRAGAGATPFSRPVLAFYYTWYHSDTFCRCTMSDLPVKRYESGDVKTIDRQIAEASHAGITGFITSWPGPGNTQDANLATLLARAAAYQRKTGTHFVSSIYFESDADAVRTNLAGAMRYAIQHYTGNPHFFRWHGKPVIFIWDPLGNGRTLATWAAVRQQVDPGHRLIWSAEGTDASLLSVFDGLHLFSAADWGLLDGTVGSIDRSFHDQVKAHGANKIWAAGVEPGWDDTRVPGRAHPHRVPRRNGATYRASWQAAMHSAPAWITITSFNEWFEGATIEPSVHYGSLYLRLTNRYASQWRHMG